MKLDTAKSLIQSKHFSNEKQRWADFGCGSGLFTHALSGLLKEGSHITAIDKDETVLKKIQAKNGIGLQTMKADFINDVLPLQDLDGILLANALHFVNNKISFIAKLRTYMKANAFILIIEYDTDESNPWVPYPLSVDGWKHLFFQQGFKQFEMINSEPSLYGRAELIGFSVSL